MKRNVEMGNSFVVFFGKLQNFWLTSWENGEFCLKKLLAYGNLYIVYFLVEHQFFHILLNQIVDFFSPVYLRGSFISLRQ